MASMKVIQRELMKLTIAFPYPERGDAELKILADMWAEDLEELSDQDLQHRIREYRKSNKFFPTSSDILSLQPAPRYHEQRALPEQPRRLTEEDIERNKRGIKKILRLFEDKRIRREA